MASAPLAPAFAPIQEAASGPTGIALLNAGGGPNANAAHANLDTLPVEAPPLPGAVGQAGTGSAGALIAPTGSAAQSETGAHSDNSRSSEGSAERAPAQNPPAPPNAAANASQSAPPPRVETDSLLGISGVSADTRAHGAQERVRIVEQVTRHLEMSRLANGAGELSLRLRPDHLGSLHLTISRSAEGIAARILVENGQVRQALEGAKEQLRATLENKGLHLDRLEVAVGAEGFAEGQAGFAQSQQTPQERSESALRAAPSWNQTPPNALPALAPVEGEAGRAAPSAAHLSRLDYRA